MREPGPVAVTAFPHHACAASWANSGRLPPGASNIEVVAMMKPGSDLEIAPRLAERLTDEAALPQSRLTLARVARPQ